jgi:hypothetical protein
MVMNVTIHALVTVEVAHQILNVNGVKTMFITGHIVSIDVRLRVVSMEHVINEMDTVLGDANLIMSEISVICARLVYTEHTVI